MQANKRDLELLAAAAQRERRKGTRPSIDVPSDRIGTTMPFRAKLLASLARHSGKRDGNEQRTAVKDILNPAG